MAALHDLLGYSPSLTTDAPALVEITAQRNERERRHLIHAVNLTGELGAAHHRPIPLRDLHIGHTAREAHALRAGSALPFTTQDDTITVTLPELELFETIVVEHGGAATSNDR